MIVIIAKFDVKAQSVDEFIKAATALTRETRKERGNLSYKIYTARKDKTQFTFEEEWLNDMSIEIHNNSAHFQKFLAETKPMLNSDIKIEQLTKIPSVFF